MIRYINIFVRFLFFILALPVILYLGAVQYLGVSINILQRTGKRMISSLEKFLDKYFTVQPE